MFISLLLSSTYPVTLGYVGGLIVMVLLSEDMSQLNSVNCLGRFEPRGRLLLGPSVIVIFSSEELIVQYLAVLY